MRRLSTRSADPRPPPGGRAGWPSGPCATGIPAAASGAGSGAAAPHTWPPAWSTGLAAVTLPGCGRPLRLDCEYRRCGRSGLLLPPLSLGLWHNFGHDRPYETQRAIVRRAFDLGITHFDLANNYGPPYGSAEENFGRMLADDLAPYRDELVISTKAGYDMWPGPYGECGLAQVPARLAGPVAAPDGPGLRRHLLLATGSTRTRRSRRRWARWTRRCAPGKALYVGHLLVQLGADPGGRGDPARARHAAADPPAVVLDAQPLDRGRRPARHAGGGRRRLHRVLPAGPGPAHRPLPGRRAGRLAGRHRRRDGRGHADRATGWPGSARSNEVAARRGQIAGPAGAGLGAARPADDLAGDRREQRRPARGQRRRAATTST